MIIAIKRREAAKLIEISVPFIIIIKFNGSPNHALATHLNDSDPLDLDGKR